MKASASVSENSAFLLKKFHVLLQKSQPFSLKKEVCPQTSPPGPSRFGGISAAFSVTFKALLPNFKISYYFTTPHSKVQAKLRQNGSKTKLLQFYRPPLDFYCNSLPNLLKCKGNIKV